MHIVQHLHEFVAQYGYFAVIILVGLESAGVPLPGETALVSAAVFAGQGTLHIWAVIACAALADRRRQRGLLGRREFRFFPLI